MSDPTPRRMTFVHLDLGIGGAERLVVNVACAAQRLGYEVRLATSHHDPRHAFDETRRGGALGACVAVYGDWLPRQLLGRGTAMCAIVRMVYMSIIVLLQILLRRAWDIYCGRGFAAREVVFIDGVSAPVPLFTLCGVPVVFYCHFPDKYLCVDRRSKWKQLYRLLIDFVEESTTGCATLILVNSSYTASMFAEAFPSLGARCSPSVLYPTIEEDDDNISSTGGNDISYTADHEHIYLSLNRYERKKNLGLAIDALCELKSGGGAAAKALLVVAGGYDERVAENVQHLEELCAHAAARGLTYYYSQEKNNISRGSSSSSSRVDVIFRTSISNEERRQLLRASVGLLYTPEREHFGIVPLEAMYSRTPVIAVRSGGPLETVLDGETGCLCPPTAQAFGDAMRRLLSTASGGGGGALLHTTMGEQGRRHVERHFTSRATERALARYAEGAAGGGVSADRRRMRVYSGRLLAILACAIGPVVLYFYC